MSKLFVILGALFVFCSCEPRIWDFNNPDICIFVKNDKGDNLFDADVEGNILDYDITVDYNGETYSISHTRATHARWLGLRVEAYNNILDDTPVLKFGEFKTTSGSDSYHGEKFTINWGDGTSDEVKFDLYIQGRHNVKKKIWLNGELRSENSLDVTIVK